MIGQYTLDLRVNSIRDTGPYAAIVTQTCSVVIDYPCLLTRGWVLGELLYGWPCFTVMLKTSGNVRGKVICNDTVYDSTSKHRRYWSEQGWSRKKGQISQQILRFQGQSSQEVMLLHDLEANNDPRWDCQVQWLMQQVEIEGKTFDEDTPPGRRIDGVHAKVNKRISPSLYSCYSVGRQENHGLYSAHGKKGGSPPFRRSTWHLTTSLPLFQTIPNRVNLPLIISAEPNKP